MHSTNATNIELRNQGIINICGKVDDKLMKNAVEELVYMNSLDKPDFKAVQIFLNSPGGKITYGFMMADFIEHSKLPVYIMGLGLCASMGIIILCAGEKGHRIITKNTSLLSHQYSWGNNGKYHELIAARKEEDLTHERLIRHYLKHTKLKRNQIEKILLPESDVWLTSGEAKKYGLIDKVVV